ncbi:MAG: four helix bundle suffix domain-containing protein [Muribaculaceae bacterium]|nr:four helix bundle suffix domain-containing protein [Muribaculaceae bacterium]
MEGSSQKELSFLPSRGGYKSLRVYRVTEIIYDVTFAFTSRYLKHGDRTVDQMIQAARSGKQNIAEGSKASSTSTETEIKLTNVAKASLEELLIDYEDYLRVRNLEQWNAGHPRYQKMREYCKSDSIMNNYRMLLPKLNDEEMGNLALTLINQATYMLRRLIDKQQEMFLKQGGIREQMMHARLSYRNNRK